MFHDILHYFIVCYGIFVNFLTFVIILQKTPTTLKDYSFLLLHDCLVESLSILAYLLVNGRLFISSVAVVIISDGPCRVISDRFCAAVTGFLNLNMIHSGSLIALSFWYRSRILLEKDRLSMWKLQSLCILLFSPHIVYLVGFISTMTSRIELEPHIDEFYFDGYSSVYGLYCYSNITKPIPRIFLSYLLIFPFCVYLYIGITRFKLLSILRQKTKHMSNRTRETHESLTKALTIHAVFPIFVTTTMIALTFSVVHDIHFVQVEGLEYDEAVLPALINPCLTLYFVRPYRLFISRFVSRRGSGERI